MLKPIIARYDADNVAAIHEAAARVGGDVEFFEIGEAPESLMVVGISISDHSSVVLMPGQFLAVDPTTHHAEAVSERLAGILGMAPEGEPNPYEGRKLVTPWGTLLCDWARPHTNGVSWLLAGTHPTGEALITTCVAVDIEVVS